jgi:hypothetical protein
MKYLKIYEGFIKTNKELLSISDSKLKIGDYVRIKIDKSKEIYKIQQAFEYDVEDPKTRFTYLTVSDNAPDHWAYDYELQLVPEEEIAAIKYNL